MTLDNLASSEERNKLRNSLTANESGLLAEKVVHAMEETKGFEIVKLDFTKIKNAVACYFVICHGTSHVQVESIADKITEIVRKDLGLKPWHHEGYENKEWILLDYVDVVVHIFLAEKRSFYKLEELWGDAAITRY